MRSQVRKIAFFLTLIAASALISAPDNSFAVEGGVDALGDQRVVALVFGSNTRASCSGVPINPYVVVAAAHCLSNPNAIYSDEIYTPQSLYIASPGVDLTQDNLSTRAKVLQAVVSVGFTEKSSTNDIAFYFLDRPINSTRFLPLANLDELAKVKQNKSTVTHLGYGYIKSGGIEDYRPHQIQLLANSASAARFGLANINEKESISTDESKGSALCKHDSGGPFISNIGGIEKLLAINLLADGCDRNGANSPVIGTLGLSPYPYLDLLNRNWANFIKSNTSLPNIDSANMQLQTFITAAKATLATQGSQPSTPVFSATCSNGKKIKKLINPSQRCPAGYKLINK